MKDVIKKERVFSHPIQKVWNAISIGEELTKWFVNADFKAESGYRYTFSSDDEGCSDILGEVKHAEPYTLVYTWMVQGTDTETLVKWQLEEIAEGTRLYLEHSGISKYPENSAVSFFNSFDSGWNNCIDGLETFLPKEVHAE